MFVTFSLPAVTLSQNKLDGKHWSVKHEEQKLWHQLVWATAGSPSQDAVEAIQSSKANVHILRVSKRLIDPLNVYSGLKWLLDALVVQGWLRGDSYDDVTVTADQRKCEKGEEPHMEIAISYP